jgi:hypothetical protein
MIVMVDTNSRVDAVKLLDYLAHATGKYLFSNNFKKIFR